MFSKKSCNPLSEYGIGCPIVLTGKHNCLDHTVPIHMKVYPPPPKLPKFTLALEYDISNYRIEKKLMCKIGFKITKIAK